MGSGTDRKRGKRSSCFFYDLKYQLTEAIRIYVRYETIKDEETGETRRELNERLGIHSPEFRIPEVGTYLWQWYNEISQIGSPPSDNGRVNPIPYSEYRCWAELTGKIVYPVEYDILIAMDLAFCAETNAETVAKRLKEQDRMQKEAEAKSKAARRRR